MGLMQQPPVKPDPTPSKPLKILHQVFRPIVEAQHHFYKTNPKDFLEFLLTAIFIGLVVVGQVIKKLPFGLYLTLSIWIICYFRLPESGYRIVMKIKKHKAKGKQ